MKLTLFFAAIDLLILLAYPVVYIVHRVRKMMNEKK
jgi:cell division protein FtsL